GLLGDLLDGVAAVAEDPGVAVDIRDRAATGGGVEECRVVRDERLAVRPLDLAELGRVNRAADDRQCVLRPGAVVDDGETVSAHDASSGWTRAIVPARASLAADQRIPAPPNEACEALCRVVPRPHR